MRLPTLILYLMLALILCLFFAGDSFGQIPELNAPCRNGQCDLQRPLQSIAVPILTAPAKIYRATPLPSFPSKTPTARRDCPGGVCPVPSQTIYRRQWIYRR